VESASGGGCAGDEGRGMDMDPAEDWSAREFLVDPLLEDDCVDEGGDEAGTMGGAGDRAANEDVDDGPPLLGRSADQPKLKVGVVVRNTARVVGGCGSGGGSGEGGGRGGSVYNRQSVTNGSVTFRTVHLGGRRPEATASRSGCFTLDSGCQLSTGQPISDVDGGGNFTAFSPATAPPPHALALSSCKGAPPPQPPSHPLALVPRLDVPVAVGWDLGQDGGALTVVNDHQRSATQTPSGGGEGGVSDLGSGLEEGTRTLARSQQSLQDPNIHFISPTPTSNLPSGGGGGSSSVPTGLHGVVAGAACGLVGGGVSTDHHLPSSHVQSTCTGALAGAAMPTRAAVSPSCLPCIPHPTPYTLHPAPYTLHPAPSILHPTPYTLHPAPGTLQPTPCT